MKLLLLGEVQPWFDPRVWISIAGMLFGNTLNASALGASTITKQFATQVDALELRLARGATLQQAVRPLMEESYRTALTPTINGLAATGIIHIPGMMSGQILAGQSPQQAALYQIMINFLIATVATLTCQLVINSTVRTLVDTRQSRLRSGILKPKTNSKPTSRSFKSLRENFRQKSSNRVGLSQGVPAIKTVSASCIRLISGQNRSETRNTVLRERERPVLELKNLSVAKAGVRIDNLTVHRGDRIAITGKSGVGKSQLLRTIVGLEESKDSFSRMLLGESIQPNEICNFRKQVALLPQNIPMLETTPRNLFVAFQQYHTGSKKVDDISRESKFVEMAAAWGLEESMLDQPLLTLSGGQAQRVSLAIAISFDPEVLLLDESTNALDEATSMTVEQSLIDSGIPIVVVTHSREQLNRFCTHKIDLL